MAFRNARREPRPTPDAMTLVDHLVELRRRFLIAATSVFVMAILAFVLYPQLYAILVHPYCVANKGHCNLNAFAPTDGLSLRVKIAGFGGLLFALPIVLWELWRFVTPGLKRNEKRYAIPFILSSISLFLLGCFLAYVSFEHALVFLKNIGGPLEQTYGASQYLSLLILVMFLYGVTFIFPVLLVALELVGAVTSKQLFRWWRPAVLIITIAAAVFTPTGDPLSMLLLMIPLIVFYFASIIVGRLLGK